MRLPALRGRARRGSTCVLLVLAFAFAATPTASAVPVSRLRGTWLVDSVRVSPAAADSLGVDLAGVGSYRGTVELRPSPGGGLDAVNVVGFDDYLAGVSEIPASWPTAALQAQAVAARSYALSQLDGSAATDFRAAGAQLCATEACQVYVGLARERQELGGRWRAAVAATDDLVLLHRGRPIVAKYSSSNGGRSVDGGRPYLRAVDDPDDVYSPQHRWQSVLGADEAARRLGLPAPVERVARSGDTLTFEGAADGSPYRVDLHALDVRARLNSGPPPPGVPRTVPSTQFVPSLQAGELVLDGRGFGHGIGMSQYGALGKALRGLDAAGILAAYYAGLRPVRAPAGSVPDVVRVALALGVPDAVVSGPGGVRISDGHGSTLAVAARGEWRIEPARDGRLRVTAPVDDAGAPAVDGLRVESGDGTDGRRRLRFRVDRPASVQVVLRVPGGEEVAVSRPTLVEGDGALSLPPLPVGGAYVAVVHADAGGGRRATATVGIEVARPAHATAVAGITTAPARPAVGHLALALVLQALAATAVVATRRSRRARQLH